MRKKSLLAFAIPLLIVSVVGCGKPAGGPAPAAISAEGEKKAAHQHESWWCDEHGVPEEVCALCSTKVAAELKAKGDWCSKHDRPDSQCFVCHPELPAKFAALYEAKYGKQPPKPAVD